MKMRFGICKIHRHQCSWRSRVGNKSTSPFYNVVQHLYEQWTLGFVVWTILQPALFQYRSVYELKLSGEYQVLGLRLQLYYLYCLLPLYICSRNISVSFAQNYLNHSNSIDQDILLPSPRERWRTNSTPLKRQPLMKSYPEASPLEMQIRRIGGRTPQPFLPVY